MYFPYQCGRKKARTSARKKVVRRTTATRRSLARPCQLYPSRGSRSGIFPHRRPRWLPLLLSPTPPSPKAICKRPHMFPRVPVSQRHSRVTVRVGLRIGNRSDQKKKNVRSRNEGHYRGTRVVYNIYTCLYMYIDIRVCGNARAQRTSSFLSASFENWHDTPRTSLQRATRPNIDRRKNITKKGGAVSIATVTVPIVFPFFRISASFFFYFYT